MSRSCERCGAEAPADGRFCPSCGAPLEPLDGAERKLATLVFVDLVESTRLAAGLDPEEVRPRLARFFDVVRSVLVEHGGTVEKYIGDAVMAAFGVPRGHSDDPDRAVAAALALVERVAELGDGLQIRVGVETGEVLATEASGDLSITGEAVNAAARLQQAAKPGEVLVGERAARSCRSCELEPRSAVEAKGFDRPLVAYRAIAGGLQQTGSSTPFVGRDDDLELLRLVYRRAARERLPELVTITGEAGVGKTRLARELVGLLRAEEPAPRVLVGRNPPYGRGIAFWALGEILREAAGVSPDDPIDKIREGLSGQLAELGADDAPELAEALVAALGGGQGRDVEDGLRRGWRRLLGLLAADRPLVIGIDDAHWADDGLLDLLEEAVFRLGDAPLVVLCTSRPELVDRRPDFGRGARNVTQIELRPLASAAATQLAASLLPAGSAGLASRVAEVSGGNPFFAEEVVCGIAEDGEDLARGLPDTVQAAIAARLDTLPPAEKRAAQQASVLGYTFLETALADLLGESPAEALAGLASKVLVEERAAIGPGRFGFRHQLIRDVAYASLPRSERTRLHELAAEGIVGRAGERFGELAELVAFHRVQANELEPTAERAERAHRATVDAASLVAQRGASIRAQELYAQAAELATATQAKVEALQAAAALAIGRIRGDDALALMRREADVAEAAGEPGLAGSALARAVEVTARMGGITGDIPRAEIEAMVARGQELADPADAVTSARLLLDRAWLAWRFGEDMESTAVEGLALARETGDVVLISGALDAVTAHAWSQARFEDAASRTRERLEMLDGIEESTGELDFERSDALHMVIQTLAQVGDIRGAAEFAARAREFDFARGVVDSAWVRELLTDFFLGDWDRALERAVMVRDEWGPAPPPRGAWATDIAVAGAILAVRGEEAGAKEWFRLADRLAEETGVGQLQGVAMIQADVDLHRGRPQDAVARLSLPDDNAGWWRIAYIATRAESEAWAGDANAAQRVDTALAVSRENAYARGIALRARGRLSDDEPSLRESLATFERIGCIYQAARTGWLLGEPERAEAASIFERLGATAPSG
jgi:class 3 adenylate cyclase